MRLKSLHLWACYVFERLYCAICMLILVRKCIIYLLGGSGGKMFIFLIVFGMIYSHGALFIVLGNKQIVRGFDHLIVLCRRKWQILLFCVELVRVYICGRSFFRDSWSGFVCPSERFSWVGGFCIFFSAIALYCSRPFHWNSRIDNCFRYLFLMLVDHFASWICYLMLIGEVFLVTDRVNRQIGSLISSKLIRLIVGIPHHPPPPYHASGRFRWGNL